MRKAARQKAGIDPFFLVAGAVVIAVILFFVIGIAIKHRTEQPDPSPVSVVSQEEKPAIAGTWQYADSASYELNADGSGRLFVGDTIYFYQYTVEEDRLSLDFEGEAVTDCSYRFLLSEDGSVLTLFGEDGTDGGEYSLKRKDTK